MAKYRFECEQCKSVVEKYASNITQTLPCENCPSSWMRRLLPNVGSKKVTEIVDHFVGARQEEDHRKNLEDRRIEHFWDVEVPRLIQTYSVETCLQEGWLIYNEKGELVLGKPVKRVTLPRM